MKRQQSPLRGSRSRGDQLGGSYLESAIPLALALKLARLDLVVSNPYPVLSAESSPRNTSDQECECEHLAFRHDDTDGQIWAGAAANPIP
jgi:hypothetical protein